MKEKALSADQIACHLWNINALLAKGKKLSDVCEEIGISDEMYQRWVREYAGQKPKYIMCLEDFVSADKKGDIPVMIDKFSEFLVYQKEGHKLKGINLASVIKISILTRLNRYVVIDAKKAQRRGEVEAWEADGGSANINYAKAHEALVEEFSKIIRLYMDLTKKNAKLVDGNLVSNVTIDVKGEVGEQVSSGLLSLLSKRELSPMGFDKLRDGWMLLGAYINRLTN